MNENIVKFIKIHVLTPVHIGAGPDKKWLKDIDFFYDNGKVKVFDLAEILKNKDENFISKVANAVSERKLFKENLIQKNEINPFIEYEYKHNKQPDEIFTHIRTGIGKAYIPGSSLKGAISSALLGYLYKNDYEIRQIGREEKIDEKVFGGVENSVMRLIQLTDAGFQNKDLGLFRLKVYSLNSNMKGQWKQQRTESQPQFDSERFVNTYECLKYGSISYTRVVVVKNIINQIENKKKPENIKKILKVENTDPVVELFKMMNEQTKSYLDKEIKFFTKHGGDKSENIIYTLERLQDIADECKPHECILHLGSGSGFHGITGDWQFNSHIITGISRNKNRGQINGLDAAKTRRLIFEEKDGDYVFYPMGFVKLSLVNEQEYYNFYNQFHEEISIQGNKSDNYFIENPPKERSPEGEEELKNVVSEIVPYEGRIKQGVVGVPAEVVESGKPNKVKIFIKDYTKNDVFVLSGYSNPIEKGKKIYVRLGTVKGNGEILQVSFERFMT